MTTEHRVLIIGGTGYIGATFVNVLNETPGFQCYALVRPTSQYISSLKPICSNVIVCESKQITKHDISTILFKYKITCVVSLISSFSNNKQSEIINDYKNYWHNLLNASYEYDPNMLVIGTSGNFSLWTDDMKNVTISPNSSNTPIPFDKYKNSMAPPTQMVHVYIDNYVQHNFINKGYNVVIAYPCSVYGPSPINRNGIWDTIVSDLIHNQNSEFNSMRNIFTSWIDVRDCAVAYRQIVKYGQKNNYYLIGNEPFNVTEVLMKLAKHKYLKYSDVIKTNFQKRYKMPISNGVIWDTESTNKKLHFKPVYSLNDEKTMEEWVNVLNYQYFQNEVRSKL